jgi:hypothetical protein
MIPALPLAYASQQLYGDRNPYRPATSTKSLIAENRGRRRRRPSLLRRRPRPQHPLSARPIASR